MKLSVIIVNYNVKYFLEQALLSVRRASKSLSVEVFVVDNNSVDGSTEMVKEKFPEVKLIENKHNPGFAFANNQAIRVSKGEYVLLLNPDTVVQEDTFEKTVLFMDEHPDAGGLGVTMIDGAGNFLPESKRGLPVPSVAFYKIFGLSRLFPKSKVFGRYHLGYLDKDSTHEIEVLSGAFMMLRKTVLDKIGLLDEQFFMYGEDIDLSYRITLAGYKNYYFSETKIIHYKGESTKKSSVNYVFVFYKAMILFAQKHFSQKNAWLFSFLINSAIFFRAGIAILYRFLRVSLLPMTDGLLMFLGLYILKNYWENSVKIAEGLHYPDAYIHFVVPAYVFVWLGSIYLSGGYDKPLRISKLIRGVFAGTIIILVVYALLPESWRFSRAIILLGTIWTILCLTIGRALFSLTGSREFLFASNKKRQTIIVGGLDEVQRVVSLLIASDNRSSVLGYISNMEQRSSTAKGLPDCLGSLENLNDILEIFRPDEVIFCSKDISSVTIIDLMSQIKLNRTELKIAPPESQFIIGSTSVENTGDIYTIGINAINRPINLRNKRVLDLLVTMTGFALLPLLIFTMDNPFGFVANLFRVLGGRFSWVGYKSPFSNLPKIKTGILNSADTIQKDIDSAMSSRLNIIYAKDYKVSSDLNIILKRFRKMGRKPLTTEAK